MADEPRGDGAVGFDLVDLGFSFEHLGRSLRRFGPSLPRAAQVEREEFLQRWIEQKALADDLFERLYSEILTGEQDTDSNG